MCGGAVVGCLNGDDPVNLSRSSQYKRSLVFNFYVKSFIFLCSHKQLFSGDPRTRDIYF